jgi:hypothetical protein
MQGFTPRFLAPGVVTECRHAITSGSLATFLIATSSVGTAKRAKLFFLLCTAWLFVTGFETCFPESAARLAAAPPEINAASNTTKIVFCICFTRSDAAELLQHSTANAYFTSFSSQVRKESV